jgi:hypothetical protein
MPVEKKTTLQRIFDIIREIAEKHEMIADNDVGDNATRGHSKGQNKDEPEEVPHELAFPYLFTDVVGTDIVVGQGGSIQAKKYKINLFVADKHSDNAKNDEDILSDTDQILTDLLIYINQNPELRQFIMEIGTTSLTPARHTTIQEAYGFQCVLIVKVQAAVCWELLPFTDANC